MTQEAFPPPADCRNNGNRWEDHDANWWQSHPQGARNNGPGWQDREQEARDREQEARNNGHWWQGRQQEVRYDGNAWRQQEGRNDGNVWRQQEGRDGWHWSSTYGWQWTSTPEPESNDRRWRTWDTEAAVGGYVRVVGERLDAATAPETTDVDNTADPVCPPWPSWEEQQATHNTDTPSAITDADAAPIRAIRAEADAAYIGLRAEEDLADLLRRIQDPNLNSNMQSECSRNIQD